MDLWRISLHWVFFFPLHQLCVCVCGGVYIYSMCCCACVSSRMLSEVIRASSISMNFIKFVITASIMLTHSIELKWKEMPGPFWACVLTFSLFSSLSSLLLIPCQKSNNRHAEDYATSWLKAAQIGTFTWTMGQMTVCNVRAIAPSDLLTVNYHPTLQFPSAVSNIQCYRGSLANVRKWWSRQYIC